LDFIGEIHPASTKGHHFVLVAIDYFTKWVEVMPLKNMTRREVIDFCVRTHNLPIWYTTNVDNRSGSIVHVASIQGVHHIIENKVDELITILCSGQWASGGQQ
jgi:hypothetical protein